MSTPTERGRTGEETEDGLYDNPSYDNNTRAAVLYDQPRVLPTVVNQHLKKPQLTEEEEEYHKVINPLYQPCPEPCLHNLVTANDKESYYATPSISAPQIQTT